MKILVSLDEGLVEQLDREAAARRVSRSALIAELAATGLGLSAGPGARPAVRRAIEALDALPWDEPAPALRAAEDSTAALRADRDRR